MYATTVLVGLICYEWMGFDVIMISHIYIPVVMFTMEILYDLPRNSGYYSGRNNALTVLRYSWNHLEQLYFWERLARWYKDSRWAHVTHIVVCCVIHICMYVSLALTPHSPTHTPLHAHNNILSSLHQPRRKQWRGILFTATGRKPSIIQHHHHIFFFKTAVCKEIMRIISIISASPPSKH